MASIIIYRTVPAYLDALRYMVGKVGRKKLFVYENITHFRVGFQYTKDVHCLDIKTVRGHYYNVIGNCPSMKMIVDNYVKDVSKILYERDNASN